MFISEPEIVNGFRWAGKLALVLCALTYACGKPQPSSNVSRSSGTSSSIEIARTEENGSPEMTGTAELPASAGNESPEVTDTSGAGSIDAIENPVAPELAEVEPSEELSGGDTTVFDATSHAFELPAANLGTRKRRDFASGNAFFNDTWVQAPSSTVGRDGLGPFFNARSCSGCHPQDGRGHPEEGPDGEPHMALLVRLSVPGESGPMPHPVYGNQLQNRALPGISPEGRVRIYSKWVRGEYGDGESYVLSRPVYHFTDLAYGEFPEQIMTSPRVAPPVFGLGLLQAVSVETILALADPDDQDGDGISGRPNWIVDEASGARTLGRFGWKANVRSIEEQIAAAFLGDIGITSSLFPEENITSTQTAALEMPNGGEPELDDVKLDRVNTYIHTLAVPARRNWTAPEVLRGKYLFNKVGCADCHIPKMETSQLEGFPELSRQTIRPFTDMLLHDMGPGLADGRPDGTATGREWRTPPLWGIGLTETVNGHSRFLHDGRAHSLSGAILWHGGEADVSLDAYKDLNVADRASLLAYLESL